jgi:pimeloyl-ACP methyl ester carboxylesterase
MPREEAMTIGRCRTILLFLAALPLAGCAAIRVQRAEGPTISGAWAASSFTEATLSPRTRQTLRRLDLETVYDANPSDVADKLHAMALRDARPEVLFSLAEIYYIRGAKADKKGQPDAFVSYYLSAGYAYHFLFDETSRSPDIRTLNADDQPVARADKIFDPRFRLACDLYNLGVAKCIIAAQRVGQFDPRQRLVLPGRDGSQTIHLAVVHHGFAFRPEEFGGVRLCSDFQVTGLPNHHRTYGLGVPLIGSLDAEAKVPRHDYYPTQVEFPITAFFRFEGGLDALRERKAGQLEFVNPLEHQTILVGKRRVPLESDLTTPMAHYLANAGLDNAGYRSFLSPDSLGAAAGLHALEPYKPGKIPIVLIHGLLSTPITWAPMFNDLQADPTIRNRYQFWVYYYPTGNPYLVTAASLRKDLAKMRRAIDPEKKDAALDDLVLVGHSMGGLVSRLLTVDGGDDFWKTASSTPLDLLRLKPDSRAELLQTYYFERQPQVRRAIFLGTPHHGSKISESTLGRLASRLAGLPLRVVAATHDLVQENPDLAKFFLEHPMPTSVDLLDPEAVALQLIADRPRPDSVRYHSVIGVTGRDTLLFERLFGGGYGQPSDGVVPYASAHIESAESELVVPADHFHVHHHPLAILEVRRILLEHLREADQRQPIRQVGSGP